MQVRIEERDGFIHDRRKSDADVVEKCIAERKDKLDRIIENGGCDVIILAGIRSRNPRSGSPTLRRSIRPKCFPSGPVLFVRFVRL